MLNKNLWKKGQCMNIARIGKWLGIYFVFCFLILCIGSINLHSNIPTRISYQGRLTGINGTPLT